MSETPKIHLVYGATASGKSAYALEKAKADGGVIINADSQQIYRELRILTARPSEEEEAQAPHQLYGALAGNDAADVAKWLKLVKMEIDWALAEGRETYVVGGTGMYLSALMHGIAEIPDVPEAISQQAKADLEHMGKQAFFERLQSVDATLCEVINAGDSQRMLRGYSVWLASGKPLTYWQKKGNTVLYPKEYFVLHHIEKSREEIYARCDARVHQMLANGALDEVKQLMALNYDERLPIMRVIGVRELGAYTHGVLSKEHAIADMQQATRNYAKRQMTWFRNKL
jgi:tRNA dimethylallyltransferase